MSTAELRSGVDGAAGQQTGGQLQQPVATKAKDMARAERKRFMTIWEPFFWGFVFRGSSRGPIKRLDANNAGFGSIGNQLGLFGYNGLHLLDAVMDEARRHPHRVRLDGFWIDRHHAVGAFFDRAGLQLNLLGHD